jgi:hypothetical protein
MLFRTRHPAQEILSIDGVALPCQLLRSKRKSLALHVRHDAVEVRAPLHTSTADVLRFLDKHQHWLKRKLAQKQQRAAESLSLEDGGQIYYKARILRVRLQNSTRNSVQLQDDEMIISAPAICAAKAEIVLKQWLLEQARNWLPERSHALADYLGVGHKLKQVVFRKTRSKWGHCTSGGRIQYNWLIMLAPDGVIDYMISHEVCHLLYMNHSPVYWQSVAKVCPDYQRYVGWLKQHEHRLWF